MKMILQRIEPLVLNTSIYQLPTAEAKNYDPSKSFVALLRALKLMKKIGAQIISVIFHPAVLQLLGYVLIWYFYADYRRITLRGVKFVAAAVLLFTWGVPLLMYIILMVSGRISSLALEKRSERNLPYFITFLCYLACWRLFYNSPIPGIIGPYTLASAAVVLFCALSNYFAKVSAHAAGCGGLTAFIIFSHFFGFNDIRFFLAAALLVSGMVISARKSLEAHTDGELAVGYAGGALISFITLFLSYSFFSF